MTSARPQKLPIKSAFFIRGASSKRSLPVNSINQETRKTLKTYSPSSAEVEQKKGTVPFFGGLSPFSRLLRKIWAFYKRDFQIRLTYRFGFFSEVIRTASLFVSFFFIGRLVTGAGPHPALTVYGGDYFRFVLLGIVSSGFMSISLGSVNRILWSERGQGTLEAILLTPTPFLSLAIGKTLWELTLVTLKAAIYLLIGTFLFRIDLSGANWLAAIPAMVLTVGVFLGLGMISAGYSLVTRESSPIEPLIGWSSKFLAGVYFPVAILPEELRQIANWLPFTYALEAVRKSFIQGVSFSDLSREFTVLLGFSLVLLPLGLLFFRWAFKQSRLHGTLGLN